MAISIFDTVSDLKSSSLAADTVAMTLGYYSVNDGGTGLYIIQDSGPTQDYGSVFEISNGKKAILSNIDLVRLKQFGCKLDDSGNDNSARIENAISVAKTVLIDEKYVVKSSINLDTAAKKRTNLIGLGIEKSGFILHPDCTKGIDGSNTSIAFDGAKLSNFSILGQGTNQIGLDLGYLTNNTSVENVSIEEVDTAIKLTKAWYSRFSKIYLKNGAKYGILFNTGSFQINGIEFSEVNIQGFKHNIFTNSANIFNRSVSFVNCEFEKSKETSVILRNFSPVTFNSCYFENNYENSGTTVMTWSTPADIKMRDGDKSILNITGTYFRSQNHTAGSQKSSISIENTLLNLEASVFSSNQSNVYDSLIYNDFNNSILPFIQNLSIDGWPSKIYTGVTKRICVKCSTFDPKSYDQYEAGFIISRLNYSVFNGEIPDPSYGKLKLRIFSKSAKSYTRNMKFRFRDAVNDSDPGVNLEFGSFSAGSEKIFDLTGQFVSDNPHYMFVNQTVIGDSGFLGWELYYDLYDF